MIIFKNFLILSVIQINLIKMNYQPLKHFKNNFKGIHNYFCKKVSLAQKLKVSRKFIKIAQSKLNKK